MNAIYINPTENRKTLRDYQREASATLFEALHSRNPKDAPLVEIPTGGGKSLIIADVIDQLCARYRNIKILVPTHRSELVQQNYDELVNQNSTISAGIYSAKLGRRDTWASVIFCSINSVYKRAEEFVKINIVLIDEAHLIKKSDLTKNGEPGMYHRFFAAIKEANPKARICGVTATPYRLDSGFLHKGKDRLFTDIVYKADVRDLIDAGYLSKLITREVSSENLTDWGQVKIVRGEFDEAQADEILAAKTDKIFAEIMQICSDRKSILIFGNSVAHARIMADKLRAAGETVAEVYGETGMDERNRIYDDFKAGKIRFLVNRDVLTIGFNAPNVDAIVILRATTSPGLYYQIVGRGLRLFGGKKNCRILDYGGNIDRHGPIDRIVVRTKKAGKGTGETQRTSPTKTCQECNAYNYISAVDCDDCGLPFMTDCPACTRQTPVAMPVCRFCGFDLMAAKLELQAAEKSILADREIKVLEVIGASYRIHQKEGKKPTLRCDYQINGQQKPISEWIAFESENHFGRKKAGWWWADRIESKVPETTEGAYNQIKFSSDFKRPKLLEVDVSEKWPQVKKAHF